jgi:hypothetical protein
MLTLEEAERRIRKLEVFRDSQSKRTRAVNELTAFNASDVLVGLGLGIKAGSNITLTKSGALIVIAGAAGGGGSPLTVQEIDGAPIDTAVTIIRVPNTSLTDNGAGDVTLAYELAGVNATHLADTADAHDASAISILDTAADFTATDVEGALAELQSDNEAHVAAADPHTGYRLESADHTHASSGAQAGTLAHGVITTSGLLQTLLLQGWQPTTTAGATAAAKAEIGTTTKHDIFSLAFLNTSDQHAFLHHPMPDNWDGGTVTFRVWWYGKTGWVSSSSDGVAWTLKGTSYGDGQVIDSVFGTGITVTDVATANNELRKTADSAALTIAGAAAGELIHWDISRTTADAADDWAASLELVSVVIEYGVTALSS